MAERSGFYPSNRNANIINNYKGYEIANVYKHIVSNGVFKNALGELEVVAGAGMNVIVKPGAGLFMNQWYENDADINFTLDTESSVNRIDLIVIEANKTPTTLKTYAKLIKGIPATNPEVPTLIDTENIKQYPLAQIKILAGIPVISQGDITDLRGQAPTLWVTGVIDQLDTSTLYKQWTTVFNNWFNNVKDTLVSSTLMRKYSGVNHSEVANQSLITIPVHQYNPNLDILQVYIEGRILTENVDYIIDVVDGLNKIELTTQLPVVGTEIHFDVFKSIDGSDAETYVERLFALEQVVDKSRVTAADGSMKFTLNEKFGTEVLNVGIGFHSLFIPATVTGMPVDNKIWRGYAHFSGVANGYVLVVSEDGDVYTITYSTLGWSVWRALYQHNKKALYSASQGNVLAATSIVTPVKALSNCANGWCLHFKHISDDTTFHYHLPKKRYNGSAWSGEAVLVEIPYEMSDDGATRKTCMKKIIISDTTLRGVEANVLSDNVNMRLWSITEY